MDDLEKIRNKAMELVSRAAGDASYANSCIAALKHNPICCFNESEAKDRIVRAINGLQIVLSFLVGLKQKNEQEQQELEKFLAL